MKTKTLKKIVAQINKGGTTYSPLLDKDYGGTPCIAISPFPERSQIFTGKANRKIVSSYYQKNRDLFLKHFVLGGWFDKESGRTYLDITVPVPLKKRNEAVALGKKANQIAGFNLSDFSEIPLGGTGKPDFILSPFKERLYEALILMVK